MEDSDWSSTYPTTAQPLPTMDTPLNFYLRCETHKVQVDTMASLNKHASLHNVQKRMRCEWTCGHCTHIFHSCIKMRRHLSLFSVRMGYAKTAEFATLQMVHKPYFRRKATSFRLLLCKFWHLMLEHPLLYLVTMLFAHTLPTSLSD